MIIMRLDQDQLITESSLYNMVQNWFVIINYYAKAMAKC